MWILVFLNFIVTRFEVRYIKLKAGNELLLISKISSNKSGWNLIFNFKNVPYFASHHRDFTRVTGQLVCRDTFIFNMHRV